MITSPGNWRPLNGLVAVIGMEFYPTRLLSQTSQWNPFTPADERLATALFERKVPTVDVEHAVLLGCARKYVALINHQSRDSIVSFSYFQNVIEEVRELQMSAEYWRHLQMRVDRLEQQWAQMKAAAAAKGAPS